MVEALLIAGGIYVFGMVTWLFYVGGMHLAKLRGDLRPFARVHAYMLVGIALVLDAIFNVVIGTIMFAELPREPLFTSRLKRHKKVNGDNWRGRAADWFCSCLLDQFDPRGDHC